MSELCGNTICCVIPSLRPGGAERVMAYLCNHLAQNGREVHLIMLASADEKPFFDLDEKVTLHALALLSGTGGMARVAKTYNRVVKLRRLISKLSPAVVISFTETTNITVLAACAASGVPVIACERTDPAAYRKVIGPLRSALRAVTYPLAGALSVQTKRAAEYFSSRYNNKIHILPNPVFETSHHAQPDRPDEGGRFRIIALGRLGPEKGYDILIGAFGELSGEFPDWDVVIFGEGEERGRLEADIARFGLRDRIALPGLTDRVEEELAASHIMAVPSHFEGFPNALAEGLTGGLPAVAFRHVSGVEELIEPGLTGLLAEPPNSTQAYAAQLRILMADPVLRVKLGQGAREHVKNWSPERVFACWDELITELVKRR